MNAESAKGHQLEQQIAHFLGQHRYTVSTNVRVPGRSGAVHELDVVGDKSDGLTSFRLVVECKAWAAPIDKQVVYKLAAELADLGAARGIIVTPSGWTAQAAQVAAQANIELWGPIELRSRLGADALERRPLGPSQVSALGTQFAVSAEAASQTLRRAAHGAFGFAGDEVAWFGHIWLPVWVFQTAITRLEGTFRKVPRTNRVWNHYDGLAGQLIHVGSAPPRLETVNVSTGYLSPSVQPAMIDAAIARAAGQWRRVTTEAARHRHASALGQLGIQVPFTSIATEMTTLAYHPLWIALLVKGTRERIGVVDGVSGMHRADLGVVPTDVVDKGRALSPRFGLLHGLTTEEDSRCPMLVRGSTTLAGVC
jgi:hypothetical protein